MNPLDPNLETGTIGELLVQIRLLQYDVQTVATHKDTGTISSRQRVRSFVRSK